MAIFGRCDFDDNDDFDDETLSKRDIFRKEIREEEEERVYQELKDLKAENKSMKRFLKKRDLYKEYKRRR